MRFTGFAIILAISSIACQPKEGELSPKAETPESTEVAQTPAPAAANDEGKNDPGRKPAKASERPATPVKKIPVAEPLAGQPGFVKSPFSGKIIDVKGMPAGSVVADPMYPMEEKKHFRVPAMPEPESVAESPEPGSLISEEFPAEE